MCEGGHFSMFPTAAVKLFGIQNGGQIFTIMFFAVPLSSMAGFVIEHFGKSFISIEAVFLIGSLFTFLNMILLYYFDDSEMISKKTIELNKSK